MTTYTDDLATLPPPSDVELEAMDRLPSIGPMPRRDDDLMTLPDFCDICLDIHGTVRREFVEYINTKCDRIEARGGTVDYPLRRTRFEWYADWNLFEAQDERQTEMGARYAGIPR